jgi:hypothetical protein
VLEVSPTAADIAHRVAEMAAGKRWRPILVLGIDGAFVPTRPEQAKGLATGRRRTRAKRAGWQGEWKEAKGFRFYLVDKERIVHLLSWHQVHTDEEAAEALRQVKATGLIPEDQVRVCVLGDGAKWIWNHVKALFPTAVQILDYYHCFEHVHKVGALQFSEDAVQAQEWVEAMMARLFWGYVDWAIEGLQALQPRDPQAAEEIRKLIGFLRNNAERLHYRRARQGGYPIGSGGIGAANKGISHVRLKRSGAWWFSSRPTTCWPCAVPSTTAPLIVSLRLTTGGPFRGMGGTLRKNYVMHTMAWQTINLLRLCDGQKLPSRPANLIERPTNGDF